MIEINDVDDCKNHNMIKRIANEKFNEDCPKDHL